MTLGKIYNQLINKGKASFCFIFYSLFSNLLMVKCILFGELFYEF